MVPVDKLEDRIYAAVPEQNAFSSKFAAYDFDSLTLTGNIGPLIWVIYFKIALIALWLILFSFSCWKCYSCVKNTQIKLHNWLFWNPIIRLLFEAYQDLALQSLLNIKLMDWDTGNSTINYSNVVSIISFILLIILPIVYMTLFLVKPDLWDDTAFTAKFGSFIEGSNLKSGIFMSKDKKDKNGESEKEQTWFGKKVPVAWALVFFIRRLIFVFSIVYFG